MNSGVLVKRVNADTTLSEVIEIFASCEEDLLLRETGLELHQPYLDEIEDFPHRQSAVLVASGSSSAKGMVTPDLFVRNKLVRSIATPLHRAPAANRVFLGIVRLSIRDRTQILDALRLGESKKFESIPLLNLILLLLVRRAIPITPISIEKAPWRNPNRNQLAPIRELSKAAEQRLKLTLANRSNDGFFSVLVLRRLSKPITAISVKLGISPNLITFISLLVGFYAAYLFAESQYLAGALLFQLSLIIDCSDGEVARYSRKFSDFGRWFDASTDRVKEYVVYAALAYSATENLWFFAIALMALQTFRHLSDYNFAAVSQEREGKLEVRDINDPDDGFSSPSWRGESEFKYWVKKVLNFPIGERWLAISTLAAIGGGELVFPGMLTLGLISLSYAWLTRIRRTLTWKSPTAHGQVIVMQHDLILGSRRFGGKFEWAIPSILRAIEIGVILLMSYLLGEDQINGALFFTLFAIVYHHYDSLYRALQSQSFPIWLAWISLKVEGRIAVLIFALVTGIPMILFAFLFIFVFIFLASAQWFMQISRNKAKTRD